ncbi:MAG: hypothetical protein JNK05_21485 [Myxococcales bacterium]|nr:hypothetical protein [Myxococcales bacterium]
MSEGRAWLWREGSAVLHERFRAVDDQAREAIRAIFTRKLVPLAEKRGITGETAPAATPAGIAAADVRWMQWFRAGEDPAPLWGLFVQSRVFDSNDADNDTWVLAAWGDGPALAWASQHEAAQRCLRAALHAPPAFLSGGVVSRDPAFAVRIERTTSSEQRARKSPTARKSSRAAADHDATEGDASGSSSESSSTLAGSPRAILAAWRRANPARSA